MKDPYRQLGDYLTGGTCAGLRRVKTNTFAKKASIKDYLTHGLIGAGTGAGLGALAGTVKETPEADPKLIVGGAGVGGALGLLSGMLRSRERDRFETSWNHRLNSIQRDDQGRMVVTERGQRRFKPGFYLTFRPVQLGFDRKNGGSMHRLPYGAGAMQHAVLIGYSDKPVSAAYEVDGKPYEIQSQPLSNGQYAISFEMQQRPGEAGSPFHSPSALHNMHAVSWINDREVTKDSKKTPTLHNRNESAQAGVDFLNEDLNLDPAFRMYSLGTFDPKDPDSESRFKLGLDLLTQRAVRDDGRLGVWNITPTLLSGLHRNNCVSWVHYLTRGLIDEGVIPEPDWKTFPKYMTGIANEDFSTNPARYKSLYGAIRNKEQKDV